MRVLVTGGAGFIGSHVVDKLRAKGHEPRILDLRESPWHSPGDVEQVVADVSDREALDRALDGCEAVIHLAAVADVADVVATPDRAQRSNVQGTLEVLEAARAAGIGRVIYGSTTWIYSDCTESSVDEETPLCAPSHLYTATKLAGELYCKAYRELFGVESTILRFGIPYGPRARDGTVIAAFVDKAQSGEPLTVAGDGTQSRRFVYVEDLAEGVTAALHPDAANRIYNLARDEEVSVLRIAEAVRSHVADTGLVHTPARPGDFGGKRVSSERAARELGWRAETSFDEGLGRYLGWRRTRGHPRRVLILSADIGEGHDLPARALAAQLRDESSEIDVETVDGLRAMGRLLTLVIRDGSWLSFNWLPWLFEVQYSLAVRLRPTRWLTVRLLCLLGARRLRKTIQAHNPDVVVSTYPGTTAVLGELRRTRRLEVPVVSAITDLAGLRFWAHPGVDVHTLTHRESIEEVERIAGAGSARWARPPTSSDFLEPRDSVDARRRLGLPERGKLVVVSGGGWGIGDIEGAVAVALETRASKVVCICGHSERARRRVEDRFGRDPRVEVLGFSDRMGDLLAAADALVHSTAGLTVLEAQIRGCPVISYGFAVGHIRVNNRAYERFGLARVATSRSGLLAQLDRALTERRSPDPAFASLPSAARFVLEAKPRADRLPTLRLRAVRLAAAAAVTFLAAAAVLLNDYAYPVVAKLLDLSPMTTVATAQPQVGLLIDATSQSAAGLTRQLADRGMKGSFALNDEPTPATLATLHRRGDDALPRLDSGGLFHSLGTRGRLAHSADALGLGRGFLYQPGPDFTLSQYLLAHAAGGSPVRGAVRASSGEQLGALQPGEIVQMNVDDTGAAWTSTLDSLNRRLTDAGLRAVTLPKLIDSGSH